MKHLFTRVALGAAALSPLAMASPALADHLGPSGFGSGGGMAVFTPDTLDGGHWAAGFRLTYTRPEQRGPARGPGLNSAGMTDASVERIPQ